MIALTAQVATETAEMNVEGLISDLAFILLLGAAVTLIFKWIKQPVVLGYIVAGFLASPNFEYLPSVTTIENIDLWAQVGIIVMLFSLGLEFSFKKLMNVGGSGVVTALIIITGMTLCGVVLGHVWGFSSINCLFLGGMISMQSTTIIIKAFTDMGLKQKKFASIVLGVLIVEDLFAVVMMVVLSSVAMTNTVDGGEMIYSISKLAFFLIIWFLVGVFLLPSLLNSSRRFLNNETLLVVSMGLCLSMAVFSVMCGFSLALGAFVMGSILAGTSLAESIEKVTEPVKNLFGAVFFISVGMLVDPHTLVEYWKPIVALSALVIVGGIVFGSGGMLVTGQSLRVAIESGFSLTQIGEFSFIIATLGLSLGVLEQALYPIIVAVSVITTFTTPYMIKAADPAATWVERHIPKRLRFLINRYSRKAQEESATVTLWHTVLRRYAWRVVLYSIVLLAMCLISKHLLLPWLEEKFLGWGKALCGLLTLSGMAPFLLALSLPASARTERDRLLEANARFDVPLIVMTVLRLFIALMFIIYAISSIWSASIGIATGLAVFTLLIFFFSSHVKARMRRIESKFLDNLNERELRRSGRNNVVVSDLHLAYMTIGYGCPFVGERLRDSNLRRTYGVNVVSISRGGEGIPIPSGDQRIFPGDTIGVIGTDEQIQRLLVDAERDEAPTDHATDVNPQNFRMTPLQLSDNSPLIGKSATTANLRREHTALVVALQRGEEYIPVNGQERFETGDTVWMVGDPKMLATLK
ncbi:MAG: cation:proton antiporter [Bacteroidales bacterium]|nr:cation:proton antiporter [Bacteroidales bacterium]